MKFKTKRSEVLEFASRKGRYVVGMPRKLFNAIITSIFSLVSFPIFFNLFIIIIIIIVIIFSIFFPFCTALPASFEL